MDLAARDVHRSLGYLVALDSQGCRPTAAELDAYAMQPDRRPAESESIITSALAASWRLFALREIAPGETMAEHLVRLRWATTEEGRLQVTALGRAAFRALEQQRLEPDTVLDVVLEATDSTAFARVVGRIAEAGPALLVEPYFRLDVLMPITELTAVTRVLASERTDKKDRDVLGLAVEKVILDRQFEVRVASRKVHDRYLIPDTGAVQFIGASLNGLGQVATAMGFLNDGSDEIRRLYETLWDESSVLATAQQKGRPGSIGPGIASSAAPTKASSRNPAKKGRSAPSTKSQ